MSIQGKHFEPTALDRTLFGILGALNTFVGAYCVSPWYVHIAPLGAPTAYSLFASDSAVHIYGAFLLAAGLCLLYTTFSRSNTKWYVPVLTNALLVSFLVRCYTQIGILILSDSWRPPSWASPAATIAITGALYVWVRLRERFAE